MEHLRLRKNDASVRAFERLECRTLLTGGALFEGTLPPEPREWFEFIAAEVRAHQESLEHRAPNEVMIPPILFAHLQRSPMTFDEFLDLSQAVPGVEGEHPLGEIDEPAMATPAEVGPDFGVFFDESVQEATTQMKNALEPSAVEYGPFGKFPKDLLDRLAEELQAVSPKLKLAKAGRSPIDLAPTLETETDPGGTATPESSKGFIDFVPPLPPNFSSFKVNAPSSEPEIAPVDASVGELEFLPVVHFDSSPNRRDSIGSTAGSGSADTESVQIPSFDPVVEKVNEEVASTMVTEEKEVEVAPVVGSFVPLVSPVYKSLSKTTESTETNPLSTVTLAPESNRPENDWKRTSLFAGVAVFVGSLWHLLRAKSLSFGRDRRTR